MSSTTPRIAWIDALKFFAIFMVLWGHCIQHFQSINYIDQPVYRIIYSFHMPLFMALSGFFAANLYKKSFLQVLKDKTRQLLLPILSLSCIFFITRKLCKWGGVFEDFWFIHIHPENWFWFLKSAFICSITYYFISKSKRLFWPLLIFTLIFSQYFRGSMGLKLEIMYPSFIFGVAVNKYLNLISRYSLNIIVFSGSIFIIMLFFWDTKFWGLPSFYNPNSHTIDLQNFFFYAYIRGYVLSIGITGTLFFISLFEYLSHKIPANKFGNQMIKYGSYTLGIYIFQTFILEIFMRRYLKFDEVDFLTFNLIICPLLSLVVLIVSISLIEITKKSKFTNFLFLGAKYKTSNSTSLISPKIT